jgi:hypothetical protein
MHGCGVPLGSNGSLELHLNLTCRTRPSMSPARVTIVLVSSSKNKLTCLPRLSMPPAKPALGDAPRSKQIWLWLTLLHHIFL